MFIIARDFFTSFQSCAKALRKILRFAFFEDMQMRGKMRTNFLWYFDEFSQIFSQKSHSIFLIINSRGVSFLRQSPFLESAMWKNLRTRRWFGRGAMFSLLFKRTSREEKITPYERGKGKVGKFLNQPGGNFSSSAREVGFFVMAGRLVVCWVPVNTQERERESTEEKSSFCGFRIEKKWWGWKEKSFEMERFLLKKVTLRLDDFLRLQFYI